MLALPRQVISACGTVQFVGWEAKSSDVLTSVGKIFKEEGLLGFFMGLTPHLLGDFLVWL